MRQLVHLQAITCEDECCALRTTEAHCTNLNLQHNIVASKSECNGACAAMAHAWFGLPADLAMGNYEAWIPRASRSRAAGLVRTECCHGAKQAICQRDAVQVVRHAWLLAIAYCHTHGNRGVP